MINIKGTIDEYMVGAMHDNYEDGSFEIFDAVKITVEKPNKLKGKELVFWIKEGTAGNSLWKQSGQSISFNINSMLIENGGTFSVDVLEEVKVQ